MLVWFLFLAHVINERLWIERGFFSQAAVVRNPKATILLTDSFQDIQFRMSYGPPHIAAHLQSTQNPQHKANLAKVLQLPSTQQTFFEFTNTNPNPKKEEKK
jgi:hypothetical protein